jgi:hypothetical protein
MLGRNNIARWWLTVTILFFCLLAELPGVVDIVPDTV